MRDISHDVCRYQAPDILPCSIHPDSFIRFQHLKMQQQLEMKDKQLQEQLSAKDRQIADLQKLLDQQQQLHRAEQEQFRLIATDANKEEKKGFFKRLFHRKEAETSEA